MREIKFRHWNGESMNFKPTYYVDNLMQFTGKQDMYGVDIYEGDILELVKPLDPEGVLDEKIGERMSVEWDNDNSWYLILGGGSRSKIIGNIYQNEDLLNVKKGQSNE